MTISKRNWIILHDVVVAASAWLLAFLARFNFALPPQQYVDAALFSLPCVILVQGLLGWNFGLYRGVWRFASLPDLINIIRAAALGAVMLAVVLFVLNRLENIPRSVLVLYPVLLIMLLGGPRLGYRFWKDHSFSLKPLSGRQRVLIIGAGTGGEALARDMMREASYLPVAFVDDRVELKRTRIHGVPVLGTVDALQRCAEKSEAELIVIAIPSASTAEMLRIVEACEATGLPFRTLPRMQEIVSGRVTVDELRQVSIDDLLGRDKVRLDWQHIQASVSGKAVLVTGGGGSIGSELCRQIAGLGAASLTVFERSENQLYLIEQEIRHSFPQLRFSCVLGDVVDGAAVDTVFRRVQPDLVFHAAAYKHVPILEHQAREAVRNNVLGTRELARAADRYGAGAFVFISTDKAVNPSSIMGATKRVGELLCERFDRDSATRFITVRFGNVLGSAGSVVPLFTRQIRAGGPVTVTHQDASRFFMTIQEACQLILEASAVGEGGEIFVLDMGEPVRITYLAEQMIRLSGREPGKDVEIVITGLRPGEKLEETLFHEFETRIETPHVKLLLARQRQQDSGRLDELIEALRAASGEFAEEQIVSLLKTAVPELAVPAEPVTAGTTNKVIEITKGK
ncbi:MAG: polysaccharide biosynthesis protein [Gammaproteobacteria bacterium]|nr:polysaccharide biosynthesis protein [Gammaproteobacteria bacterium]NNL99501.1 polysaccharide biosynthesis protein [Gammaproteobacteria bacterium]